MKKSKMLMAAAFVLAVGSAFATRPVLDGYANPGTGCQAGTIQQSNKNCGVQSGTPCTILFGGNSYQAYGTASDCASGINLLNYNN